jgi:acrylyl-CoA reductase (NADPH)
MTEMTFRAMVVTETPDLQFIRSIQERRISDLPPGDILVAVHYSSLNYKDALSATGNKGVTRKFPHTPGIDAAGIVAESSVGKIRAGDKVIVTSYDLGMNTAGGFGQYIRVPADWVVPLPPDLTLKESMMFGTAGLTAGLAIHRLMQLGATPPRGEILVTGATGGVGSLAVAMLSKLGYRVTGVSGKANAEAFLKNLGAEAVITRDEASEGADRPLLRARWSGVVDTVGGAILTAAIKSTQPYGTVVCCGNAASHDLPLNVFPFILRGVTLTGIDSQNCPMALRETVWHNLADKWRPATLTELVKEIDLNGLDSMIDRILEGRMSGRCLVRL